MKTILKLVLLFFLFSVLFVLPAVFIPPQVTIENPSPYNALMILILLIVQFLIIIYLIQRLNLLAIKLFLTVVIVFWGLQTFMTQIETWYFIDAMPAVSNSELANLFVRPLITSITFIPLAMWVLGKWKENTSGIETHTSSRLNWKEMLGLSIAYVIIYFVFGYFVAWQFEAVRVFYSGSPEDAGFFGQLKDTLQTRNFIFAFQFVRGFLWIIIGLPILLYLKGSTREKILTCTFLYVLPVIQLIVDNPYMPQPVRVAHLLEVASSNGLFGFLIGYTATRNEM
jgi:hypothetical protein